MVKPLKRRSHLPKTHLEHTFQCLIWPRFQMDIKTICSYYIKFASLLVCLKFVSFLVCPLTSSSTLTLTLLCRRDLSLAKNEWVSRLGGAPPSRWSHICSAPPSFQLLQVEYIKSGRRCYLEFYILPSLFRIKCPSWVKISISSKNSLKIHLFCRNSSHGKQIDKNISYL